VDTLLCADWGGGAGGGVGVAGGLDELYLTGDSLARKSRSFGSRFRRGSLELSTLLVSEDPQNQPIVEAVGGLGEVTVTWLSSSTGGGEVEVEMQAKKLLSQTGRELEAASEMR